MIGIIGGTGLEKTGIFNLEREISFNTEFGEPSSLLSIGKISNIECVLIRRHGEEHTITPSNVNNRANISALKEIGCKAIIATSACGSLKEDIGRGDLVLPDQFIDFTRHRKVSFYEHFAPNNMQHTPMADPYNEELRNIILNTANNIGIKIHKKGTVISIEGPRFSTRAESHMFRLWGADIINMTTAPETILANEAGIPYALIALSTDYDCWKTDEKPVSINEVMRIFNQNISKLTDLLIETVKKL